MASLVVAGDTSGSVTLSAPSVSGSTVLTLPTTTGTLVVTGGAQTIEFADGSAAAPSITNSGDTNTGMFFPAADSIGFTEGGAEIARFDSSGQFIVGPFGGNGNAVIAGSSSPGFTNQPGTNLLLKSGDGSGTGSSFMTFSTSPAGSSGTTVNTAAERMRITSSGNVGIGTGGDPYLSSFKLDVQGKTSDTGNLALGLYKTGTPQILSGDVLGNIYFYGVDNSLTAGDNNIGARISSIATTDWTTDGTTSNAALVFYTHGTTSGAAPERMRIASDGNIAVGATGTSGSRFTVFQPNSINTLYLVNGNATTAYGMQIYYSGRSPNNTGEEFIYCGDTGQRFSARSNGGLANYSGNNVNLSDEREKTNIELAGNYLSKICSIPVKTFNYIDQNREEDDGLTLGVIAQDVQNVAPELIMESNWGTKEEPKMRFGIYQTDLQYALMKCIQEQQQIINDLKARIETLEGAK